MKRSLFAFMMISTNCFATQLPFSNHSFGVPATDESLNLISEKLEMPSILQSGQVPVLNQGGGYAVVYLDPISRKCVDYCKEVQGPLLDIGAGYGTISLAVLKETNVTVIAEDIGVENLLVLRKHADIKDYSRLFLNGDRFPDALNFIDNCLGAVAVRMVFHFLKGDEIDAGLQKIFHWLIPGGKLFIVCSSPYIKPLVNFIAIYEERVSQGILWPGHIDDYASLCPQMPNLPLFLHVIDFRIMSDALLRAGFEIEEMTFVDRRTIPSVSLDGRESIGVIAIKPVR
jgi:SAM-dependent methyltransferase